MCVGRRTAGLQIKKIKTCPLERVGDGRTEPAAAAASMDFHALPRRDLQALCKRNGIRANMTNVAMADALAALPAVVDGIEKEAAAATEEGEMQGISLPGVHGVALTPHEVIILDDSEEEDKDLMPGQGEEKTPALRDRKSVV